jgi:hypothetical protein
MNPNDELDRILDHALTEYRDAEPLAGMEDRILRRIAAQPEPGPRRWAWILAAAGAAAVIVFALWLGLRERPHQQPVVTNVTRPAQQPTTSAHVETPASSSGGSNLVAKAHKTSRRPSSLNTPQVAIAKPVLKQFPAPAPLTSEEHALLALARTHPDALLSQRDDSDQLTIEPIEIKPLAPEAGAPQGEQP